MTKRELLDLLRNCGDDTELLVMTYDHLLHKINPEIFLKTVQHPTEHVVAQLYLGEYQ